MLNCVLVRSLAAVVGMDNTGRAQTSERSRTEHTPQSLMNASSLQSDEILLNPQNCRPLFQTKLVVRLVCSDETLQKTRKRVKYVKNERANVFWPKLIYKLAWWRTFSDGTKFILIDRVKRASYSFDLDRALGISSVCLTILAKRLDRYMFFACECILVFYF